MDRAARGLRAAETHASADRAAARDAVGACVDTRRPRGRNCAPIAGPAARACPARSADAARLPPHLRRPRRRSLALARGGGFAARARLGRAQTAATLARFGGAGRARPRRARRGLRPARPHSLRHSGAAGASIISGRTREQSARPLAAREPRVLPPRRRRTGRSCSTSTRSRAPKARTGSGPARRRWPGYRMARDL